jgi:hypothetical protein
MLCPRERWVGRSTLHVFRCGALKIVSAEFLRPRRSRCGPRLKKGHHIANPYMYIMTGKLRVVDKQDVPVWVPAAAPVSRGVGPTGCTVLLPHAKTAMIRSSPHASNVLFDT